MNDAKQKAVSLLTHYFRQAGLEPTDAGDFCSEMEEIVECVADYAQERLQPDADCPGRGRWHGPRPTSARKCPECEPDEPVDAEFREVPSRPIEVNFIASGNKTTLAELRTGELFRFDPPSDTMRLMVRMPDRGGVPWYRILNWGGFVDAGSAHRPDQPVVRVELASATVREID